MPRSVWKGPHVEYSIFKKCFLWKMKVHTIVYLFNVADAHFGTKIQLSILLRSLFSKTWVIRSRSCSIVPMFSGVTYLVHTGRLHLPVPVRNEFLDNKTYFCSNFGSYVPTRIFSAEHRAAKKRKK